MTIETWTPISELDPGTVFVTMRGVRAVKSEYHLADGRAACILLASGEYAQFGHGDDEIVRRIDIAALNAHMWALEAENAQLRDALAEGGTR